MEPKDDIMKNWQEKLTAEFDEYKKSGAEHLFDSVYLHMLQTYVDGDYVGNPVLIQSMCEKAPQTYAWMRDMGFDWKPKSIVIVGSLWPRANMSQTYKSGIGFIEVLKNDAEKKNFPIDSSGSIPSPSIRFFLRGADLPPFGTKRWRQKCPQGTFVGIGRRFSLSGHKRLRCFAHPLRALEPPSDLIPLPVQCGSVVRFAQP